SIAVVYRKSVMNAMRSAVTTTIAELPPKFVRYRMFGSAVTTTASSASTAAAVLSARRRQLIVSLGACDMDGPEPLLERLDRACVARVDRILDHFRERGHRRRNGDCERRRGDRRRTGDRGRRRGDRRRTGDRGRRRGDRRRT